MIFDEVISGFRLGFEGAAGYYDIQPDIITYGKIIGGGLPVGAYGASKEIMSNISPEGNVYQAGTLSGNPVAMSAGIAQLTECLTNGFYEDLEIKTKKLVDGLNQLAGKCEVPFKVFSIGSIFWIAFSKNEKISSAEEIDADSMRHFRVLHEGLLNNGIYLGPSGYEVGFVSASLTVSDIERTISVFSELLPKIRK